MGINVDIYILIGVKYTHELHVYLSYLVKIVIFLSDAVARLHRKVQVGKDQEKAQSAKDSHSKNRGGKKPN